MLALAALMTLRPAAAVSGDEPADSVGAGETIEVKRAKITDPKHPTLRFLNDNRVFLRARLDLLRLQATGLRSGDAQLIDERFLMLQQMAAAIAAARDTVDAERELAARRELLKSVSELADLEAQLDLVEKLLADERDRLLWLEAYFMGRQETALVIVIRGLSARQVPESIVLTEEANVVSVALTPEQRASLAQGGIAQIYHEIVEPREHAFLVGFTGDTWSNARPLPVVVEAARDRMTFLELDLRNLDREREGFGILTSIWRR
jgi:hypothetical protein